MSALRFNEENRPRITRRLKYGVDKFILVKNCRLHYLEAGQGEPLLFLPAPVSARRMWKRLAPVLSQEYRVIVLEDYGTPYGRRSADPAGQSTTQQANTLATMVRQLALPKVNLVCVSGTVALEFASGYPDLTGKIAILGGPVAAGIPASADIRRAEKLKLTGPALLYIYGGRPPGSSENPAIRKDIEFLEAYLPHAWIAGLETGLFRSVLKDPGEIAGLVNEFLGGSSLPPATLS